MSASTGASIWRVQTSFSTIRITPIRTARLTPATSISHINLSAACISLTFCSSSFRRNLEVAVAIAVKRCWPSAKTAVESAGAPTIAIARSAHKL